MGATSSKNKTSFDDGGEVNFDHFQILRAIGKGSFGKVCIVQKKDSNQMYAMKYMNKSQCIEKDAVRNVLREIELLAMLEHPFLVNLWFSFQDAEDMFMVVDLLLGGDLRYHIQQNGRFDEERVHFYVCEIALALDYLREKHILHRDIKPDNILLDEEGHVHITDFNIATILNDGQLATSMTGTKPYMAPEVFDCALDECPGYSYAVDWWSLGVCAFEMLRGKRPFDIHSGTPITDVRHMFTTFKVHFPSSIQPSMKDLLKKLLCVNPLRRISTLEEFSKHPSMADVNFNDVLERKIQPVFVPPKDHLNCDPTFELEEMIIEAKPLHKKKKRLSKQNSKKEQQGSMSGIDMDPLLLRLEEIQEEFMVYNRERELELIERERKEQEWQEELERHMNSVDPMANYRQDLKLPLRTNLHLSPSHHKGPFVNSADKSPAKSSLKGMELSKSPIKCTRATSPMRWLDSPRREWVQDKASPLAAVDIMGEVGSQEDSSSTSTDSPATTHQFRNIKVTASQVSGNGEVEAKSQETELAQSSPNVASIENFYLWAENNSPVELSKKDNQNFQFSPTQVSRTKGQHFWNEHYRMSSSLSHDSDNDIGGGRILNQDSPLYKSEFGFPRQDSGTTDSMVSCCTSFSNPGNLADLSTPEVEALSK